MDTWQLEFYETASGNRPIIDFLRGLPADERRRVGRGLALLEDYGTQLGMPWVRPIQGSALWELRIRGSNHYRVFYVTVSGRRLVALHAFGKKSEETPLREIRTAEARLAEYRERYG
ncbi:MAG: type II toxin-antitoxin system RelE/ParE family toxin [Chloroflexia bacterium]|nr:type II toxin-antitoxin system RelE/ParE family toxin [Chloroflexia bacterium]